MTTLSFTKDVQANLYLQVAHLNDAQALQAIEAFVFGPKIANIKRLTVIPNGKPQHVQMLLHALTLHFPEKLQLQHDQLWKNQVVQQQSFYHILHHLIESNRFVAAALVLKNHDKQLMHLLNFAKRLKYGEACYENVSNPPFYFDVLTSVLRNDVQASESELKFVDMMTGLLHAQQLPFLYFLQSYSAQLYDNTDLTDFVGMYYRLAEELLLYAMGWDATNDNVYLIRQNAAHSVPLPVNRQHVTRHFNSYMRYLQSCNEPYAKQLYNDFNEPWLLALIQLRHDGLSGHGYKPYSHERIHALCNGEPLAKLQPLLAKYGATAPFCFFTLLKTAMAARAKQLEQVDVRL